MTQLRSRVVALAGLVLSVGCGSDNSGGGDVESEKSCVPGQSVSCSGPSGCAGVQVCDAEGARYDTCVCSAASGGATNKATTQRVSSASGGTVGHSSTEYAGFGGIAEGGQFTSGSSRGGVASTGGNGATASSACAPKNMDGYGYPSYKAAREMAGVCTETEILSYYTECFSAGNCSAFKSGGASASCGACLVPSELDANQYGPLIKLGTTTAYVSSTNLSGCIELQGEAGCAKKIQMAQLCEYQACADSCPLSDQASYQTQISCMMNARSGVCSDEQAAAVCVTDAAHVAACSGSDMKNQFVAVARVFCM